MIQQYHSSAGVWKKLSTSMLTAALLTIAKTWTQPKCPLTDESRCGTYIQWDIAQPQKE